MLALGFLVAAGPAMRLFLLPFLLPFLLAPCLSFFPVLGHLSATWLGLGIGLGLGLG